ncbi:hypothetical protein CVT24_011105 [Panaeolus cyanescens]|uniref:Cyclin N-terminal domain-containing protein n=1 Tax=Panaeolus cyanescens TaxID=181874 RepID=A0A409YG12_9AGAR|nr:hypothetical protein CVT24_011105 [Panaeolus cyanescens]
MNTHPLLLPFPRRRDGMIDGKTSSYTHEPRIEHGFAAAETFKDSKIQEQHATNIYNWPWHYGFSNWFSSSIIAPKDGDSEADGVQFTPVGLALTARRRRRPLHSSTVNFYVGERNDPSQHCQEPPFKKSEDLSVHNTNAMYMCKEFNEEYAVETATYWKQNEISTMPHPDYITTIQKDVTWEDRDALVIWVIDLHQRLKSEPLDSIFLSINIVDRCLSKHVSSISGLRLLGTCALLVALKQEATMTPASVGKLFRMLQRISGFSKPKIILGEAILLKMLEWRVRATGPLGWLHSSTTRLEQNNDSECIESKSEVMAHYLALTGYTNHQIVRFIPSTIAGAAIWLSRLITGRVEWTPEMERLLGCADGAEIIPVAKIMIETSLLNPIPHVALFKKYRSKKFHKCSSTVRQWSLAHWTENSQVDLLDELPLVKAGKGAIQAARRCHGAGYCC